MLAFCFFFRESPSVKIPEKYNAAYRLPAKVPHHSFQRCSQVHILVQPLFLTAVLMCFWRVQTSSTWPCTTSTRCWSFWRDWRTKRWWLKTRRGLRRTTNLSVSFMVSSSSGKALIKIWEIKQKTKLLSVLCLCVCEVHELDDEVAAALFEKRTTLLDKESVGQLTSDNFHDAVAQSSLTVALFYFQCKGASPQWSWQACMKED